VPFISRPGAQTRPHIAGREREHGYKIWKMGRWVPMAPPPRNLRLGVYLQVRVQMLTRTRAHARTHTAALDTQTGETPDAACSLPKILQLRLLKKCKTGGPCISPSKVANLGFPVPGSAGARAAAPCAPLPTHAQLCPGAGVPAPLGTPRLCKVRVGSTGVSWGSRPPSTEAE